MPPIGRKVIRTRKRRNIKSIDETIENSINRRNQFILILGPVGAGKTTFIHFTRKISASKLINNKILWFHIDYKRTTDSDSPKEFIYRELLRLINDDVEFQLGDWNNSIKPAYRKTIDDLQRGPLKPLYNTNKEEFEVHVSKLIYEDREKIYPYVEKIIFNATKFRPGFLIIDNVDQIENEEYQNKIFNEAQAAARLMNLNVIMSLRESTYLKHKDSPVFDAFQVDAIYIDPPKIMPVLSRRFNYGKNVLKNKKAEITTETGKRFRVPDLSIFFEIVSQSLLSGESGFMLEILSGSDIRRGLSLVREFLASAHISADQVLFTYITNGNLRKFPPHEVFKGIILGQKKYFREEESLLINLFDSKLYEKSIQLLKFRILFTLVQLSSMAGFEGLEVSKIQSELYRIGISAPDVFSVLTALFKNRTIITSDGQGIKDDSKLFPSRFGGYLIREFSHQFLYIEPCLIDSTIFDDATWDKLLVLSNSIEQAHKPDRIPLRLERARIFIEYLRVIDEAWISRCKRYSLNSFWEAELISSDFLRKVEEDLNKVMDSAQKVKKNRF